MRCVALLSLSFAACAAAPEPSPALVVASDLDNMPFAGVAADGTPIGRDVEMMEALAVHLQRRLHWQRMPFDQLLPAVENGDVDVVCATIGVTPERAQRVAFSRPYFDTGIAVLVRTGDGQPRTLAELAGKRVHAGRGTTSERAVRNGLPAAVLVLENKEDQTTVQRLLDGDLDAAAMDGPAARRIAGDSGGRLVCLAGPLAEEHYALVLQRDARELRRRLDAALAAMQAAGELERLDRSYGLPAR